MLEKSRSLLYDSMALLTVLVLAVVAVRHGLTFSFVDAHAYEKGFRAWLAGGDPYAFTLGTNFLYPPVVLLLGAKFTRAVSLPFAKSVYLSLHFAASVALPWILYRYYLGQSSWRLSSFYLIFLLAPGFFGLLSVDFANIALICYAAMLLAGVRGIRTNRWLLFYLAVFCSASIKFTFLPMLLLPLLCGKKQAWNAFLCGGCVLLGLEAQALLVPGLYRGFRNVLVQQSATLGDLGKGVFGILFHILHKLHLHSELIPFLGYGITTICILAAILALKRRHVDEHCSYWPAIVLLGILFAIPRLNFYDLCIGFPLVFCLAMERTRRIQAIFLYAVMFIPSIFFFLRDRDTALNGGFELLCMLGMMAALLHRLFSAARLETVDAALQSGADNLLPPAARGSFDETSAG